MVYYILLGLVWELTKKFQVSRSNWSWDNGSRKSNIWKTPILGFFFEKWHPGPPVCCDSCCQLQPINVRGTVSSGSFAFHSTSICCSAWNLIPSLSSWRWILSRYLWTILETFSTNNFSPRVSSRVFCKYDIAKWDHKILTRVPGHRQLFVVLVCLLLGKYHPEKKSIDLNLLI